MPLWPDLTDDTEEHLASWVDWLRQVWASDRFAAGVEVASPDLARRVHEVCEGRRVRRREVRRAVLSLARYLLRTESRATPFGLFSGVAPARFGSAPAVRFGEEHRAVARVDSAWLDGVVTRLEAIPELSRRLLVVRNNLAFVRDGRLVVGCHQQSGAVRGAEPVEVSVRYTEAVHTVFQAVQTPVRLGDLADKLASDFPERPDSVINGMLAGLVAQRLLVTSVRPPMIGPRLDGSGAGGNLTPHYDTDNGRWDGDTEYDRAVGPNQHLPSGWPAYGADGNGDGSADPHNVYDSALASARELCLSAGGAGVDFTDRGQLADALFRYNRSHAYVADVLAAVDRFDTRTPLNPGAGGGSEAGQAAAAWALRQVGKPYVWGGTGPHGFDCSGLTQAAWAAAGVSIPRVTTDQVRIGIPVGLDELQPGDLLFYDTGSGPSPSHVTMYVGDGQMVNAPSTGQTIRVEPVQSDYYSPRFTAARRPA
ncbi:lantibiotic dehydratase [Thermobifida halotolerans]|uniref:lantibiotic dehydratase n=1 Tax=Thermobifida halotolerans TaxID=483545 RepID=UPI000838B3EE|nr:lantibiotic dehydratase [Thermobifida halotolerans]